MLSSKNVKDRERPWGFSSRDARKQALLDTAIGIGWDFVGGIGKLGGKVSGKAVEKLVSKIDKGIAKAAIRLGGNMLSEGVEEAVQTVLEPVFWAVATGESFAGVDLEEVVYSGLLGALSAGFIEGGGRNAKAELQVKDNGGSGAAGLRLLKSAQPASDAPLSLRGRSPWQSASSKAIDYRGTYDKNGTSGGTDSSLQAQNDPEVSNRNANLQAQRVNTEPSADTQAAGRGGGVEAYAKLLREVMAGTGSDVTGANRWSNGVAVQASGGKGRIIQGDAVSPVVKQTDRLGSRSLHTLDGGADADVPVRQSDAGKFGVEQYGELLHQAGQDWDTAGKLSEIGLRVPSNIAESRNMAAPNVTAIPSGSMKAAGPQQRAVAADAEGYARRLQEAVPEFAAENGDVEWYDAREIQNKEESQEKLEKQQKPDIINIEDFQIGNSLGAKAKNYQVMDLETGELFSFVEGTRIQNVEVFAGKGVSKPYWNAGKYVEKFGGKAEDWQHVKGEGWLDTPDGDRYAEIHWSQCEKYGKVDFFIKRWKD